MKRFLSPIEITEATIETGVKKASLTPMRATVLGILGGLFIAFGAQADITIMQTFKSIDVGLMKFFGAAVFPVGLMLVIIAGGELFTGNNLMTLALLNNKISLKNMLRNWFFVYLGNFVGAIILVELVVKSGLYPVDSYMTDMAISVASGKMSLTFSEVFIRGIMANFMVALAVWMSYSAQDVSSKIIAIWFPVMLFVLSGFEHSIANLFFLPLGKAAGLDITWAQIFAKNILPSTLGNIVGGGIIIPFAYNYVYLSHTKQKTRTSQSVKKAVLAIKSIMTFR